MLSHWEMFSCKNDRVSGGSRIFLWRLRQLSKYSYFANYFTQNCMKMQGFGPWGEARFPDPLPLPDPPMNVSMTDLEFPQQVCEGANPWVSHKKNLARFSPTNAYNWKIASKGSRGSCSAPMDQPMRLLTKNRNILSNITQDQTVQNNTKLCYF